MENEELKIGSYTGDLKDVVEKYGNLIIKNPDSKTEMYCYDRYARDQMNPSNIDIFSIDYPECLTEKKMLLYIKGFSAEIRKGLVDKFEADTGIKTDSAPCEFLEKVRDERSKRNEKLPFYEMMQAAGFGRLFGG